MYPIFKAAKLRNKKASLVVDKLIIEGRRYTVDSLDSMPEYLHPKSLSIKQSDNAVMFYGRDSFLSNFYPCNFSIQAKHFCTVEQYFQFQKACAVDNKEVAEMIMKNKNPSEQHRLGRRLAIGEAVWNNETAIEVMETALEAKFSQNEDLKKMLLATGDRLLIECNKYDKFWSNGLSLHDVNASTRRMWKGKNALGDVLIKIRENLK